MIDISMVTGAIVAMGVEATWEKIKRNEAVIKTLISCKIDPADPPTDFDSIYIYTLIEYGIDRPEPILNFFRNKFVREAFQQSFYKNDPSILDKEAQEIIYWNEETNKLGQIDYDPRREFAAFSTVFHSIVSRTRKPSEVKRDQKLDTIHDNLHRSTGEIIERLDRLTALSEVRKERSQTIQNDVLENLNKEMKSWFKTLNYGFEEHEELNTHYFEWIINVPARRGYDRIVVRGIEGASNVSDIISLRECVTKHRANEGWLVSLYRVEQSARDAVNLPENRGLFCYSFDELLDEDANFERYFSWLEDEVKRRSIDKMYVPLACTKEDFDVATKAKIGESSYDQKNGWIDGYIDRWLDDPSKEHISVLGEFGTGKTWFTLHYAWVLLQRYLDAKAKGMKRPRLPLVIPLRDYAKAVNIESLFSEFFFRKHEIPLSGYSAFEQLNHMGKLLLIFDGFDEMVDKIDRQKMINNFWELARVVIPGSKVILTCRTEHFPDAKEGRALLSAELQASTANLTGEPPQFEILKVKYFNESQIRQVLTYRTKPDIVENVIKNHALLDLARRPVMVELILEALPEIEKGKPIDMSRIYLYAVQRKMERDIKDERTFTSLADKIYFLCELSWEMLSTDQMSLNYRLFPDRLRRLFGSTVQEQKDLDHWHYDMMGQTLLVRNDDGDYSPAHRSLLEFFVAYKFAAELGILSEDFAALAQKQSYLDKTLPSQDYVWSSYFQRIIDKEGEIKRIPLLKQFLGEDINYLVATVGKQKLTPAILDLMKGMINSNREEVKKHLLSLIQWTRGKTLEEVNYLGGNIASIMIHCNQSALEGLDLSSANLRYANLKNADLRECILDQADLSYSNLQGCNFTNATLQESKMSHAELWGALDKPSSRIVQTSKVCFYYSDKIQSDKAPQIDIEVQSGQIVVGLLDDSNNLIWKTIIESLYIFDWYHSKTLFSMLTIEGQIICLDLQTGQFVLDDGESQVLKWLHADLNKAQGVDERTAYILKIYGAINTPVSEYDPKKDGEMLKYLNRKALSTNN